jgi:hypothetical protein
MIDNLQNMLNYVNIVQHINYDSVLTVTESLQLLRMVSYVRALLLCTQLAEG